MNDYEAWVVLYVVLLGLAESESVAPLAVAIAYSTAIGYWFWFVRNQGTKQLRSLIPTKAVTTMPTAPTLPATGQNG